MRLHSRLLSSVLLSIGLTVLAMEFGDPTIAARGSAPRAWTREGPSRRATAPAPPTEAHAATRQRVHEQYGRLPLRFEQNECSAAKNLSGRFRQSRSHHAQRRFAAKPHFERGRSLMEQHR